MTETEQAERAIREALALKRDALRLKGLAFPVVRVRYAGPTDNRGSRFIASCRGVRYTHHYDYALDASDNAAEAAWVCWKRYYNGRRWDEVGDGEPCVLIPGDFSADTYAYVVVPERFLA